jgi:GNAT superfamily N-acetyltransferase
MSRSPSRRPAGTPFRLSPSEICLRLDHPVVGPCSIEAKVIHRLSHTPSNLFSHGGHTYFGIVHDFTLRLTAEELAWAEWFRRRSPADPAADGPTPTEKRTLWEPLAPLGDVAPPSHRIFTPSRLLVARVQVQEIPLRLVNELDVDFKVAFSDHEEYVEFEIVDALRATDDGFSLRRPLQDGGSLLLVRDLEVHPAFAGQLLGARLLGHTVWELTRHPGDLVYLGAYPWRRLFARTRGVPQCSSRDVARLVNYYERLGFHRAEPEKRITGRDHVRLYRHVGAFGLPISGLGWLSERAGHPRLEPVESELAVQ